MPDFMNPSEDLLAGLAAGRNEKQDEVDALSDEIDRLTADLTALREAVKAFERKLPPNSREHYNETTLHMLHLANADTTGDTDHANR